MYERALDYLPLILVVNVGDQPIIQMHSIRSQIYSASRTFHPYKVFPPISLRWEVWPTQLA